jgi:hypothetical protein
MTSIFYKVAPRSKWKVCHKLIGPIYHRMIATSKLYTFLNGTGKETDLDKKSRKSEKGSGLDTHNGMEGTSGSWRIAEDDMDEFYRLYCDYLRIHGQLNLTEKSTTIGPMRIDLDFKYAGKLEDHLHTQDQQVHLLVYVMLKTLKLMLVILLIIGLMV